LIVLTGALLVRNLFNALLFAHGRFVTVALAQMASHLVFAGGMILTVRLDWGLYGVAGTLISVQVLVTLVDLRQLGWMGRAGFLGFLGYAWKVQVSTLLTLVTAQKDQLVAGRLLSAQNSGPFGQGSNLAAQLSKLPLNALSPMQSVVGADVGRLGVEASKGPTQTLQLVWVRFAAAWLAIGAPATYVGVRAWLPDSFELTGVIVPILMCGLFFQLCGTVLVLWCLTVGRPGLQLEMMVMGLAVNVVLSVVLYLAIGMMGVVVATAISNVAAALYLQFRCTRTLEHPLRSFVRDIPVLQMLVIAGVTAALELLAEPFLPDGFPGIAAAGVVALPGVLCAVLLLVPRAEVVKIVNRVRRR
ncbi:MAG: polysaccharide biosynthesis C-terminal domain-containing protein, partial [Propionibacteriaceae bacterium]|nr:polysaccharide biosynthesis C-terminal domain-containing protein [Propionibacteriaceae bacterium]